jgi:hypothetical protein
MKNENVAVKLFMSDVHLEIPKKRPRKSITETSTILDSSINNLFVQTLKQDEINDIQSIQQLLMEQGMDDDMIFTPEDDQNNTKNEPTSEMIEIDEEYDIVDIDADTLSKFDLQTSQFRLFRLLLLLDLFWAS